MAAAAYTGVSVVLGGTAPWPSPLAVALAAPSGRSLRMKDLTRTTFAPLVGSRFIFRPQRAPAVAVVLSQATGLPAPAGVKGEACSLLFTGPLDTFLEPGIHALEHPALGSIQMFVTPVGRGRVGHDYEVIVNRNSR